MTLAAGSAFPAAGAGAGVGSTVSISGQAGANGVYPIDASTRTLATMLAKSGGVTIDPATAIVRVTRGGHTGKIWLKDLYENPSLDIALRPGDKIMIEDDSRKFIALGATGAQSTVPFVSATMSALGMPGTLARSLSTGRESTSE